jgi:2-polyprenyl-6-methoxyphenol hydroxylase-like FAD-dependent oxidoreductase
LPAIRSTSCSAAGAAFAAVAEHRTPVLIVGGGPVGLALAIELGSRGVPCTLVEQGDGTIVDAKMFATGIRTVEFCRRWGIAERVKDWGFPRDFPFDNVFVTSLAGHEIGRIAMPSIAETKPFDCSPEQFAHCPQFVFDPILAEKARSLPGVTLRYRCTLTGFREQANGVVAELSDMASGTRETVRARHLVGCDGFSSAVRKALGIGLGGVPFINRSVNVMFRCGDLAAVHDKGRAGRYVLIGPEGPWASLTPADGRERWRLMIHGDEEDEPVTVDAAAEVRRAAGRDFDFEILSVGHWVRRRMVADRYRRGRVFIAGDAAHVMPPNGGLGMNTGVADAVDLGWKLAAVICGWGGQYLLDSYEAERRPVGTRQCDEAMRNFERYGTRKAAPHVLDETPEGAAVRAEIGRRLASGNRMAWENPVHTHLGYRYDHSPICIADGAPPCDPEDARFYEQTSDPGGRAPHVWLVDGRSTLDLFGRGFTLLRFGPKAAEANALADAAKERGVPLDIVDLDEPTAADLYARRLVLVRPDGHVAWRGNAVPSDPLALIDRVRGALAPTFDEPISSSAASPGSWPPSRP